MSYSKYYNPTNWENYPSEDTAVNAMHLNNLEDGVDTLDDRIVALSTDKSEVSWNQTLISGEKIAEITVNGITKDVYAPEISDSVVEQAAEQALKSEGYAVGTQGDIPVTSGLYYHNNSKYYSEQSSNSASDASASAVEAGQSADDAEEKALVSEGWANGKQNGVPVEEGSPYYHNNAKWYSEQANPTTLANLTDTDIDNPQANQPLSYDGEKWINDPYLKLVSPSEKELWNDVSRLYQYTELNQIAQINANTVGVVAPIAIRDYAKDDLFIQQKKLCKAITAITQGDELVSNTNYIEVNVGDELGLKADISAIGTDESGRTTASKQYVYGERFYKDGKFCRTKTDVAQGATWTLNTNYEEGNIADWLKYGSYQIVPETGVTFATNQGGVFGKTVDVYIKMSTFADSDVQAHKIGTSALRPCSDYAFLNIMRDYDPYEVIGQVFITGLDGRVGMPRGLPTNTTVFIHGQFITKD